MYIYNQPNTSSQEMNQGERNFFIQNRTQTGPILEPEGIVPSSDSLLNNGRVGDSPKLMNKFQKYELEFNKLKSLERQCVSYAFKVARRKINEAKIKLDRRIEAARKLLENEAKIRKQEQEKYEKIIKFQQQRQQQLETHISIKIIQFNMIQVQNSIQIDQKMGDFFELYFRERRLNQHIKPSKAEQAYITRHYFENHEEPEAISRRSRVPLHMINLLIKAEQRKRLRNQRLAL